MRAYKRASGGGAQLNAECLGDASALTQLLHYPLILSPVISTLACAAYTPTEMCRCTAVSALLCSVMKTYFNFLFSHSLFSRSPFLFHFYSCVPIPHSREIPHRLIEFIELILHLKLPRVLSSRVIIDLV